MLVQCSIAASCRPEKPAFLFVQHSGNQNVAVLMVRRYMLITDDALRHISPPVQTTGSETLGTLAMVSSLGRILQTFSRLPSSDPLFASATKPCIQTHIFTS